MRHLWFSLFAIGVAAVAAMTATTAMLNAPRHPAAEVVTQNVQPQDAPAPPAENEPAPSTSGDKAPPSEPAGTADTGAGKPAAGSGAAAEDKADEDADKDPYEGIAPEELPPDLQYSADSSVSFPTNI